eukprot:m.41218 g.41218  ORF g.41218 m.41218 type:complete len:220 (-) comp9745_c0_seq4:121-780(-)
MIIPPYRFSTVESGVFRSAQPHKKNFPFLNTLKLKSIIALVENLDPLLEKFAEINNIYIYQIKAKSAFENITIDHGHVTEFLNLVIDYSNHPCLIHCYDGHLSTGIAVMCLRKLQLYSVQFSVAEFERFGRADAECSPEDLKLVESFKGEIKIPTYIPDWLWNGDRNFQHPIITLTRQQSDYGPFSLQRESADGDVEVSTTFHALALEVPTNYFEKSKS